MNATIQKFGYPSTLLKEYDSWVVLLRPKQVTAGSMVLACKETAGSLAEVSVAAYQELPRITSDLEAALRAAFRFDKINYMLLMMVDKEVHFHVVPRYAEVRSAVGVSFSDPGWPKHPDMKSVAELTQEQSSALAELLRARWPTGQ